MNATQAQDTSVGIDDMRLYVPSLYLPIETLAEERQIEVAKLQKGLGLYKMAVPDKHEDAATMAANAAYQLMVANDIDPNHIGRIYLGTESALDGAKPTATYIMEMLRQRFKPTHGRNCMLHCDVVDMTFACIGAVDALQNCLDWVRLHPDQMAIVVSSDNARYELGSTGEYTQGAGAVAMLIKAQPRLLVVESTIGVATRPVHDFFKPLRKYDKEDIVQEMHEVLGIAANSPIAYEAAAQDLQTDGLLRSNDAVVYLHKETPVFDGPYSNDCYQERIHQAYDHFVSQSAHTQATSWDSLVFHLPYAFHGQRIFTELFVDYWAAEGKWKEALQQEGIDTKEKNADTIKAVAKSATYKDFIHQYIAKGQLLSSEIGNMYTGSIFLGLLSQLLHQSASLQGGERWGCFAYGSGSKSKVFEVVVQQGAKALIEKMQLNEMLNARTALDYPTYEVLHRKSATDSVIPPQNAFYLDHIETEGTKAGARYYGFGA